MTNPLSKIARWLCVVPLMTGMLAAAQGDAFPSRPIRLIVPYAAGGGSDTIARVISEKLAARMKVTVVVENRPGAGGVIGNDAAVKAAPDGYTLLLTTTAVIQQPVMIPKLPYDFLRDMQPLTVVARGADMLMVPKDVPANTLAEFVALAKADPKTYGLGIFGSGTASHIHAAMFNAQAGLDLTLVTYKGAAPLLNDLLGGQIRAGIVDFSSAQPHLGGGRVKVLAVSGANPSPLAPQAPTFTKLGYRYFDKYGWFALFTQAATPPAVVKKLGDELVAVIALPDVQARLLEMGLQPGGEPPQETAKQMRADAVVWERAIKESGVRVE